MKELLNFVLKYKAVNLKTTNYIKINLKINISILINHEWNNFHGLLPTFYHIMNNHTKYFYWILNIFSNTIQKLLKLVIIHKYYVLLQIKLLKHLLLFEIIRLKNGHIGTIHLVKFK